MRDLRIVLFTCSALIVLAGPGEAEDIDYGVTVKGSCKFQTFFGWTDCQDVAEYTLFKSGRYLYHFVDKDKNVYSLSGRKDRQLDNNNLYSNIDTIDTTINGTKVVDSHATGGCHTEISSTGDEFVHIDCDVTNSKSALFQFRMHDITRVERSLHQ